MTNYQGARVKPTNMKLNNLQSEAKKGKTWKILKINNNNNSNNKNNNNNNRLVLG